MTRPVGVLAAAAVAAVASAGIVATTGSAQEPGPRTLHIVGTPVRSVGFGPTHKPRQGDTVGFGDRVTGDETGFDRGTCTYIGSRGLKCDVIAELSGGQISAEGIFGRGATTTFIVTGGTGQYAGVRGTAVVTQHAKNVEVTYALLP